jgi:hypothetical protein
MEAVNHGGAAWLSIVCIHAVDDGAQLLVGGASQIHRTSSVATRPRRSELGGGLVRGGLKLSVTIDG